MTRVLVAAIAVVLLTHAAPAVASTLVLSNGTLTFTGAGTAANDVTISGTQSGTLIEINDSDVITGGTPNGCTPVTPTISYVCGPTSLFVLDLGAGDDTVTIDNNGLQTPTSMLGGEGSDDLDGGALRDVINGGPGDDTLIGNAGNDEILGSDGADNISGNADNDALDGGVGDDTVNGGAGDDAVNGADGDDELSDGGGSDVISGGAGFDQLDFALRAAVSVSLDGAANDGAPGETGNVQPDVEDVFVTAPPTGTANLSGSPAANLLIVGEGTATIDGLAGADVIRGSDGDDTIQARDGYPDRITCFTGTDTVLADPLDSVSPSCENVQIAAVPGPPGLDDHPPAVAWSTPAAAASFRGEAAQTLSVTATDDRGLAKVQFFDEDRLLCEDTAAPYTCAYKARGADVGRNTLVAVAIDTAGQATSAIRLVTVQKFRPTVPLRLSPSRDRRAPYKFTAKGTIANAGACSGTVVVTAKAGKRTISSRRAKVNGECRYSIAVSFKSRVRSSVKFSARYEGNTSTAARSSASRTARLG